MRSNRAPFTDLCQLISIERQKDGDGYHTTNEIKREIFCSVSDGVNRAEYYAAMKAGVKLSATIEVNEGDYCWSTRGHATRWSGYILQATARWS